MRLRWVAAAAILLVGTGCYMKTKNQFLESPAAANLALPYAANRVTVSDFRVGISTSPLVVTGMSRRGEQKIQPLLTPDHEQLLTEETRKNFQSGPTVDVEIRILKGEQRLLSRWVSQKESGDCEVEVRLTDSESGKSRGSARGAVQAEMQSPSASTEYSDKLYRATLRDSLLKALTALNKL